MTRAIWKHHAAVAALIAAPLLLTSEHAFAQPKGPPSGAVAGDTQKATAYYLKGSELFKAKKFIPALEQFKLSYQTVPSPNSHLYIARCMAALGDTRAAWVEFDKVSEEAAARAAIEPKYAPTRDSANMERDELNPKLGLVTIDVQRADPSAKVRIGTWEIPSERWHRPFPVDQGTYEVKLERAGRPPVKSTLTIGRGERRAVTLDGGPGAVAAGPVAPPPRTSRMSPLRIAGITTASVGVVGFVMFAVAGAISTSTYSDLKTKCGGDTGGCGGLDVSDEISKGRTQQAIANAGLIIGAVGVAAGATMIVLSLRPSAKTEAPRPRAELVVKPTWVGLEGSF